MPANRLSEEQFPNRNAAPPEANGYSPWPGTEPNRKKNVGPQS